jgi:catechol 2,3-dioxygenase-like lactoylglutathione lyase family enzyme
MGIKVVGLHHANVRLPAANEQQTREFYGELLGLVADPDFKGSGTTIHWQVADTGAEVHTKFSEAKTYLKNGDVLPNHFALQVDDLEAAKAHLMAKGVHFEEAEIPGARHEIFIKDPSGNIVELQQAGAHH